ncbi:hypothetical protein PAXRUDRAFT_19931 [Paxillus rubicundulus Ve08.2h10]|uniref:Unplaced genomic scaffold scaffold_4091, whole genome shotgun sequence n=1 Tax=Paxillus rubicundulus Ve08.2h10 TaxID=930991 RepID=A0A0D0CGE6_9AGAM|nr:hypothetical protein PAXRUDRAFT_19931 [Paxillus rubicundulus Ve08.2h10]
MISGHLLDAMIAGISARLAAKTDGTASWERICVESLTFSNVLRLSSERWKNYETDKAFTHLRTIGDALRGGTINHLLFPLNIHDIHWAVLEVHAVHMTISYADTLNWSWPTEDINQITSWLEHHGFKSFAMSNRTSHGMQLDAFSCGVAAINTIKHAVFDDKLFADENKFCLRMEEFLALAYSHLKTGADDIHGSEHHSDYGPESSSDIEVFDSPGLLLDAPSPVEPVSPLPPARQKTVTSHQTVSLKPEAGALAQGHRLLWFFPKIPFAWEVEDQEWNEHRLHIQQFEHQAHKRENARERKQKQRAREKATKQSNLNKNINTILHDDTSTQSSSVNIAQASNPHRDLPTRIGYGMSPIQIERELKRMDPARFSQISAQVIGTWIDRSGTRPVWKKEVVDRAARGCLPRDTSTRSHVLTPFPNVMKTIIDDLWALRTVGVALDTTRCRGLIIA